MMIPFDVKIHYINGEVDVYQIYSDSHKRVQRMTDRAFKKGHMLFLAQDGEIHVPINTNVKKVEIVEVGVAVYDYEDQ